MKKLFLNVLISISVFSLVALGSCGKKDHQTEVVEQQNTELYAALQDKDYAKMEALADSMGTRIDDLTPNESITLLLAFLELHNNAATKGEKQRDLEFCRSYVDVYDLAAANNPNDFAAAVEAARRQNSAVDLEKICEQFRDALSQSEFTVTEETAPAPQAVSEEKTEEAKAEEPKAEEKPQDKLPKIEKKAETEEPVQVMPTD